MTDIEKLDCFFDAFGVDVEIYEKSIKAAGRRFFFDEAGEIERIIDYGNKELGMESTCSSGGRFGVLGSGNDVQSL